LVEVLINQEQVDVKLEDERTLGEVMEGLQGWLNESQLYITDVTVDEQDVKLDAPESWAERSVDDIDRIEILALPPWEVRSSGLQILVEYFSVLKEAVETGEPERIADLASEAESVSASLPVYASDLVDEKRRDDVFLKIVDAPEVREGRLPEGERREELLTQLSQAVTVLNSRVREIERPYQEAGATARTIRGLIPKVNEVSVLLQRGEDRDAMNLIVRFTELLAKLLRIMPHVARVGADQGVSKERLESYGSELNATLEELVGAFNSQDSVLIGDLVEYELVPKVEELLDYVPEPEQSEQT
jgi:hypothetical protein